MRLFYILFIGLVNIYYVNSQTNENLVILDMQIEGKQTTMIGYNGEVLKVFSADEKVKVTDEIRRPFKSLSTLSSFVIYDFDDGFLPVQVGDKWLLYDNEGNEIQDFGNKYYSITKPSEGIYRVYEQIEGKSGNYMVYYIDRYGKEMFQGRRFWEATSFKEDIAFAQIDDKNGEWVKLDSKNETMIPIDETVSSKLYKVDRSNRSISIATLNSKNNYAKVLIDNNGKIVFDANEAVGKRNTHISFVSDQMTICNNDYTYYFFDSLYNKINEIYPLSGIRGISSNMVFTRNDQYFDNLLYHDFRKVEMDLPNGHLFICDHLDERWVSGIVTDTISRSIKYTVFDNKTLESKATTDKTIGTLFGDRLIEIDPESYMVYRRLMSIIDLNGDVLYRVDPSNKIFRGINSTKSFKPEDIHHIELNKDEDITELKKFKNIESIEFSHFTFSELPTELKKFKNLEELKLYKCNNLASLPTWLSKFKKLKKLSIDDCVTLSNIEDIIVQLKGLSKVYTMNYSFKSGFEKEMKQKNPSLTIDSWHGGGDWFETIIEEK